MDTQLSKDILDIPKDPTPGIIDNNNGNPSHSGNGTPFHPNHTNDALTPGDNYELQVISNDNTLQAIPQ